MSVVECPLEALGERAPEFDLVAVSVVQSADGRIGRPRRPARRPRVAARPVVLDVTQSLGWLPTRLGWADAVVCAGYKWLLCPRGVAWLAVDPGVEPGSGSAPGLLVRRGRRVAEHLRAAPAARGLGPPASTRRPAWFSHVGAAAVLPWLAGLDRAAVRAHCVGLADAVRTGLDLPPAGSAIVAVDRPGAADRLAAAGVVGSLRAGAVRLSFHLYNTADDVARVLDALT